jgi:hypothetical protein
VFHWPTVQACKQFLLSRPDLDLLSGDGASLCWDRPELFLPSEFGKGSGPWLEQRVPFFFPGLGIMLRRESLALLGLCNLCFIPVDHEYCARVSSNPGVRLAWCNARGFVRVLNPDSNSVLHFPRVHDEVLRINEFYLGTPPTSWSAAARFRVRAGLRSLRDRFRRLLGHRSPLESKAELRMSWAEIFERCEKYLDEVNRDRPATFLAPEPRVSSALRSSS